MLRDCETNRPNVALRFCQNLGTNYGELCRGPQWSEALQAMPSLALRVIVALDRMPWAAVARTLGGYGLAPVWAIIGGRAESWTFVAFFGVMLIAVRIGGVAARRILRFDRRARQIWEDRRQTAKRFDSYQWRKMLWFGLGLGAYCYTQPNDAGTPMIVLACLCVAAGAAGEIWWQRCISRAPLASAQSEYR